MANPILSSYLALQLISTRHVEQNLTLDTSYPARAFVPVNVPIGYTVFPEIGVAYKYFPDKLSWNSARKRCINEGGNLAVIDSRKKFQFAIEAMRNSGKSGIVGIHRLFTDREWVSLKTDLPLTNIPWQTDADLSDQSPQKCVILHSDRNGVSPCPCDVTEAHICEVSLTQDESLPINIMDLPNGYTVFPDIGVAYKFFENELSWYEAQKDCISQGGDLAVVDSWEKIQRINGIRPAPTQNSYVGIHRLLDHSEWTNVKTGLPVATLPWTRYSQVNCKNCRCIHLAHKHTVPGLYAYYCDETFSYICQVAISDNPGAGLSLSNSSTVTTPSAKCQTC